MLNLAYASHKLRVKYATRLWIMTNNIKSIKHLSEIQKGGTQREQFQMAGMARATGKEFLNGYEILSQI